jgi:acetolactate synthase small subunit
MTKGEYRVGITFNPSGDDLVNQIKRQAADLIDLIEAIDAHKGGDPNTEVMRLKSLAQTQAEDAAMWAVKAATKGPWV